MWKLGMFHKTYNKQVDIIFVYATACYHINRPAIFFTYSRF
jgi:hypothetical protein